MKRWPTARPRDSVFTITARLPFRKRLRRAVGLFSRPEIWNKIVATGMQQDWSWSRSAREYTSLYERTLARIRTGEPSKV